MVYFSCAVLPDRCRDTDHSATSPVGENTAIAWDIIDENRSHYESLYPHPTENHERQRERQRERRGYSMSCRMYDHSFKCWFLLCLFIYPTHSEVTPWVSCGGSWVHLDAHTHICMYAHTHHDHHHHHQTSHLATVSKNITPEKGGKILAQCGRERVTERERDRDEELTDQIFSLTS